MSRFIRAVMAVLMFSLSSYAEDGGKRSLAVFKTTDSSQLFAGDMVQKALVTKFGETGFFAPKLSSDTLTSYTKESLASAHSRSSSDIVSFAYIDRDRVAVFLFDVNRPGKYIATSETLGGSPTNRLTADWLLHQLDRAFSDLVRQYSVAKFEEIPSPEPEQPAPTPPSRAEKARTLFHELSALQDGAMYLGANLGIARFSAAAATASTVNVGAYFGMKALSRLHLEAGVDVFSYLLLNFNGRFRLPLGEKYVSLFFGAGASYVATVVTQNRGFNPTSIPSGSLLYGPSITLDVPLLGANIRGDIRLLVGSATVLIGTYGLAYTL